MKKKSILLLLLAVVLALALAGCGGGTAPSEEPEPPQESGETGQEESSVFPPFPKPEEPGPIPLYLESDLEHNRFHLRKWPAVSPTGTVLEEEKPPLDFTVELPESWAGNYDIGVDNSGMWVFCPSVREEWGLPGTLFSLDWSEGWTGGGPMLSQPGIILRDNEEMYLALTFPSDMQGYGEVWEAMGADYGQIRVIFADGEEITVGDHIDD